MNFPKDDNGAMLQEMSYAGIDLSHNHDVDFFHLFEKQPEAEKMAKVLADKHPEVIVKVFADETPGVWDVSCTVNIQPSYENICAAEKTFESIAEKYNGYADGWGLLGDESNTESE
jgi:hypothetical protein